MILIPILRLQHQNEERFEKSAVNTEIEIYLTRIVFECAEVYYMCEVRGIMAYVHL